MSGETFTGKVVAYYVKKPDDIQHKHKISQLTISAKIAWK